MAVDQRTFSSAHLYPVALCASTFQPYNSCESLLQVVSNSVGSLSPQISVPSSHTEPVWYFHIREEIEPAHSLHFLVNSLRKLEPFTCLCCHHETLYLKDVYHFQRT